MPCENNSGTFVPKVRSGSCLKVARNKNGEGLKKKNCGTAHACAQCQATEQG